MANVICKNDEALRKAGVLACQFDTPYCTYIVQLECITKRNNKCEFTQPFIEINI